MTIKLSNEYQQRQLAAKPTTNNKYLPYKVTCRTAIAKLYRGQKGIKCKSCFEKKSLNCFLHLMKNSRKLLGLDETTVQYKRKTFCIIYTNWTRNNKRQKQNRNVLNKNRKGKFAAEVPSCRVLQCLDRKPPQKSDLLRLFLRERHEKTVRTTIFYLKDQQDQEIGPLILKEQTLNIE